MAKSRGCRRCVAADGQPPWHDHRDSVLYPACPQYTRHDYLVTLALFLLVQCAPS